MLKYPVAFRLDGHMAIDMKYTQIDFWSPYMKSVNKCVLTVLHKHLDDEHNGKNAFNNNRLYLHLFQIRIRMLMVVTITEAVILITIMDFSLPSWPSMHSGAFLSCCICFEDLWNIIHCHYHYTLDPFNDSNLTVS